MTAAGSLAPYCRLAAGLLAVALGPAALAQPDMNVEIKTIDVAPNIFMLQGAGGNIGLCVGDDGAFLIDDQYAPMTEKILAAVKAKTDQPVRFVVNTHWHGDHTGGNENMGKAGAIIVAHENVRERMSEEQFLAAFDQKVPPAPPAALPVITFTDSIALHWNDEEIRVQHLEPAHTDGDSLIYFLKADVLHMGDCYFNGMYPFIDVSTGGSIDGMIRAVDGGLKIAGDKTKIIPGHGSLSGAAELKEFRDMLIAARDNIRKLVDTGKSREEAIAAKPTAELDAEWGDGFMKPDVWVGIVYDGMKKQ